MRGIRGEGQRKGKVISWGWGGKGRGRSFHKVGGGGSEEGEFIP